MDLQMEKQLFQGNDILYFILVSWISKWKTNCYRGIKQL